MSRSLDGRLFPWVLFASVAAHLALPLLRGADAVERPDFEVEERIAAEPMTVRILQRATEPTAPVPENTPLPVLTSQEGARAVESFDLEPVNFDREPRDIPPPQPVAPEPPTEPETEPVTPPLDPPAAPPEEAPPPLPTEVPKPTPPPPKETAVPVGPIEQESQSGVISRAVQKGRGNRAPNYPRRARATKQQGTTKLEVFVRADGTVEKLSVYESSGHTLLDDEAMKAVKRWKFTPAMGPSGSPTEDRVIVPVVFKLR